MNKEKFVTYKKVQHSGLTNMFDINTVCKLSNGILNKDDCMDIMENYSNYQEEFQ